MKVKLKGASGFISLEGVDLTDKVFDAEYIKDTEFNNAVYVIKHKDLVDAGMDDWGVNDTYPVNFFPSGVIVIEE